MIRTADIVGKVFTKSFMGYDMQEVDAFLDEIIEELERYEAERKEMTTAMEYLLKELENLDHIVAVSPEGAIRPELESASAKRKKLGITRVGASLAADAPKPPKEKKRVIAPVALEVETGSAAPSRQAVAADERNVPKEGKKRASGYDEDADIL